MDEITWDSIYTFNDFEKTLKMVNQKVTDTLIAAGAGMSGNSYMGALIVGLYLETMLIETTSANRI